jgi:hypothetical protein
MPRRSCRFLFPLFIVRLGIAPYDICISENVYRWLCLLPGLCDEKDLFDRQSLETKGYADFDEWYKDQKWQEADYLAKKKNFAKHAKQSKGEKVISDV